MKWKSQTARQFRNSFSIELSHHCYISLMNELLSELIIGIDLFAPPVSVTRVQRHVSTKFEDSAAFRCRGNLMHACQTDRRTRCNALSPRYKSIMFMFFPLTCDIRYCIQIEGLALYFLKCTCKQSQCLRRLKAPFGPKFQGRGNGRYLSRSLIVSSAL